MSEEYVLLKPLPNIPAGTKGILQPNGIVLFTYKRKDGKIAFHQILLDDVKANPDWFQKVLTFEEISEGIDIIEKYANDEM